ncbi:nucleobase:cation symporter-2 family protein [Pseudonocardia spinosispora]|uniref:nucleobase:cation symporter-2 family protein n=1 Tax=Pseudonocardia spinosispora TaxID=103441 RepID=UPI00048E48B8|nr:nucleobase:cation symporter-2 family protein [Pseudonocardia spinosispora]
MTLHPVDERPPVVRLCAFAVQHVLIMYAGCITVPLVFGAALGLDRATIGLLINADLLVAGVITIVQSLGIGKLVGLRLPVVCGATFAALSPMIVIGKQYGLPAVYGSMLAGGAIGLALAVPFAKLVRFFPPLITGIVLTVVGLSLIGVAGGLIVGTDPEAPTFGAPSGIALAAVVIAVAIAFLCLGKGLWTQLGVLVAMLVGTAIALSMGLLDLSGVGEASWFGVSAPFHFGAPTFPVAAVVAMVIVMMVVFTESTASMMAVSEITGRPLRGPDLARGLVGEGLSGILGGVFNAFIDTVFTQNVGALATTRMFSRFVTATSGVILIVLGLVPKLGALVAALPAPVIGGVGVILFATVALVGINTLRRVDLGDRINTTIAATSIGIGLLPAFVPGMFERFPAPAQILLGSGLSLAAIVAFALNLLFNHTRLGVAARAHRTSREEPSADAPV